MSRFNTPDYGNNGVENYLINPPSANMNESHSLKAALQMQEILKGTSNVGVGNLPISHDQLKGVYMNGLQENMVISNTAFHKRARRSVDGGIGPHGVMFHLHTEQTPYDHSRIHRLNYNGSSEKIPYRGMRTMNIHQTSHRDYIGRNNPKLFTASPATQDTSNIPLNAPCFNSNGTQMNKIKTMNSSGSSSIVQSQPQLVTSSQNMYHSNDFCNQLNIQKMQNLPFSLNKCDFDRQVSEGDLDPNIANYPYDYKNISYAGNNKLMMSNVLGRKDSIPEYYEPDSGENFQMQPLSDAIDPNASGYPNRGEQLLHNNFIFTGNCYMPVGSMTEVRNSGPYMNQQQIPIGILSNNVNVYPQNLVSQIPPFPNNIDQMALEGSESFLKTQRDFLEPATLPLGQTNIDLSQNPPRESCPIEISDSSNVVPTNVDCPDNSGDNTDIDVKTVGKFTVTTSRDAEKSQSTPKSPEITEDNTAQSQEVPTKDAIRGSEGSNQQPRSRFKKTRIKETVERWHTSGLNTYDFRIKVIPSKIMDLKEKNLDFSCPEFEVHACQTCGAHDSGYHCYSNEYKEKEFRFWDNGDRIAIRGKPDCDLDSYCQFHAKYLKLLNQNQNISLSKFVPQCSNLPNGSQLSSPQIVRTVLISSPDNEHYAMNIDSNTVTQNVALSAPPVSPSLMHSSSVTALPSNLNHPPPPAAMVVLRCHTPVLSNVVRNASLMNEAISVERINSQCLSTMSIESDSGMKRDNASLVEIWQGGPRNSEFPEQYQPGEEVFSGPSAFYPHILYTIPQQIIPSMSKTKLSLDSLANGSNRDDNQRSDSMSSNLMQEIDENLNSLRSLIQSLVQAEQEPLLAEIRALGRENEGLQEQLAVARRRCEYLEAVLREHGGEEPPTDPLTP